eukprot:TRINITY_DN2662_c0_g1_i3.p1 TRINITY_DN2662_c0_g1~~TRINITY_DN2662_c0_g1_i3.p1  ORF type:complete len:925 (+),score=142.30 TRINITY_DN2662_c0_g1_i3:743-3517(+)
MFLLQHPRFKELKDSFRFVKSILTKLIQSIGPKEFQKHLLLNSISHSPSNSSFSSMRHSNSQDKPINSQNYRSLTHSQSQSVSNGSSSNVLASNSSESVSVKNSTTNSKGSLTRKSRGSFAEAKYATKNFLSSRKSYRKLPKRTNNYRFGDSLLFGGHLKSPGEIPPKILNSFSRPISGDFKADSLKEALKAEEAKDVLKVEEQEMKPKESSTLKWTDNTLKFHANVEVTRLLKKFGDTQAKSNEKEGGNVNSNAPITPSKDVAQRTEKWMDSLIKSVITVEKTEVDSETRQNASKTLVRLLIDEFLLEECSKNSTSSSQIDNDQILLTLFIEILLSNVEESRIHAFDLLYNIQVQIDALMEKSSNVVEIQKMGTLDRVQAKKIVSLGNNRSIMSDRLYSILQELITFLSFKEESSEPVWTAAFKVLVFFLSEKGRLKRQRLATLDVRIISTLMNKMGSRMDVESERLLVRMLANCFYGSTRLFDPSILSIACSYSVTFELNPIDSIISRYVSARSMEERENLFVILYDFIIHSISSSNKKHGEIIQRANGDMTWLLEVLRILNAPHHFVDIFLVTPRNFGERIWNTLAGVWPSFAAKVDKQFSLLVLQEGFEKLALQYTKLPEEIQAHLKLNNLAENRSEILNALLHSSYPANRRNGERWLAELLMNQLEDSSISWLGGNGNDLVNKIFHGLCQSSDFHNRRTFLNITQILLIFLRYKMNTFGEESIINKMGALINENITRLVKAGEKNPAILRQCCDIIFSFISNPLEETTMTDENEIDTIWSHFLSGKMEVSKNTLRIISISNLPYLLNHLPECSDTNSIRVVLLYLIICKCTGAPKEVFDSLGGIRFMEKLTASVDPTLSYIAGRFIIEQLEKEDPDQYMKLLKGLLMTAQEQDNADLIVHNEYWQIKTLKTILDKKAQQ